METEPTCTAFAGDRVLASGAPWTVAVAVRAALARDPHAAVLTFDDLTGRVIDFDLRGTDEDIAARLKPEPRAPGRPKLGVTAREVTLLPRHWDWLAAQPGGASVTLRKLIDAAARSPAAARRQAMEAADRFMRAILGDQPGYEEAARALYAGDGARFTAETDAWPADLRDHARRLAAGAFQ